MAYVVIAYWTAKDGEEDAVAAALTNLTEPSRAEPGNLAYVVHRDPEDARRFVIYEQYADEAAYQAHAESEHFRRFGKEDGIPRLSSREREFLVDI
ncbi:MAG: antibiotic biosynthesis monooxygenase [Solirubrobacterales bacterium 70-9]|nr:MAG: antibiotic biosynthesis monooxygenase [Solirubrobacterales bacterium 70-9]